MKNNITHTLRMVNAPLLGALLSVLSVNAWAQNTTQTTPPAAAPEGDTVKMGAFEVTGSRIKRLDSETVSPVVVLRADDMRAQGFTTIADAIRALPFNNGQALDAAALEVGRLELHRTPVDLAEIVRATLGQLESAARAKAQTLDFAAGSRDDGVLEGDAGRLAQVVTNLVSNAIKYSPRGAPITVGLERAATTVRITVRDRGPGVAPAELPHLFKPFSRLSARPTAGESTVGLGLSLAHDLVRLHGGTISVACPPEGGSVFTVELPIRASSPTAV
ncbi:MAG TPA: HAMP domain-containing sensor histidine kinase [Acidobacteriota bacterium]|nr:HAMP domain-containing sensor histidine kinase [Acidobacteriota bacterium]